MNYNSLTLHPHVMKLCRLAFQTYQMDARQTKMAGIVSVAISMSAYSYIAFQLKQNFFECSHELFLHSVAQGENK